MQEYNILFTQEAIRDIADIAEYIDIRFGSVCSDRFQDRLKNEITRLGYMGGMFFHTQIFYKGHAIFTHILINLLNPLIHTNSW